MLFFRLWNLLSSALLEIFGGGLGGGGGGLKRRRVPARRQINYPPEDGRAASFVLGAIFR